MLQGDPITGEVKAVEKLGAGLIERGRAGGENGSQKIDNFGLVFLQLGLVDKKVVKILGPGQELPRRIQNIAPLAGQNDDVLMLAVGALC